MDALNFSDTIKTLAIIAEGVPESQTREIIKAADDKKVRNAYHHVSINMNYSVVRVSRGVARECDRRALES